MSEWLMEDELEPQELLELYDEARAQVDKKYPRRNDIQTKWLYDNARRNLEFLVNWFEQHDFALELRRDLSCDSSSP